MDGDECFLDTMGFGYTQTQPESPIGEQATPSTQHEATASTQQRSAITEKAKSNKGKNWSSDEDKVLIAAWANTSLDIVGTDQNRDAYWARISEYYNAHKESSWPERNANAINCRYTLINRETSKFCGCLQQILNREESGKTIEQKTRGLKHGRAIVVSTCTSVASIVSGVVAGMIALDEHLPTAPTARFFLLLGWFFIITGVILLVTSTRLIARLPKPVQKFLKSNMERSHSIRRPVSSRGKDPIQSTTIHASSLHILTSPGKEKA